MNISMRHTTVRRAERCFAILAYLRTRIKSSSNSMISETWTFWTPSCSIKEVKTACSSKITCQHCCRSGKCPCARKQASWLLTSSDSIVLQPPLEASSAIFGPVCVEEWTVDLSPYPLTLALTAERTCLWVVWKQTTRLRTQRFQVESP